MTPPTSTTTLADRRHAFAEQRLRIKLTQGPTLTPDLTWPAFWTEIHTLLRSCGYKRSTRRQYRHVLRALRKYGIRRPADVTPSRVKLYIHALRPTEVSWNWIAQNIAILRTVFDRLCGLNVTDGLVTPKRGFHIPETLGEPEAQRLVLEGTTIRDQLLLGLLYGCGLTGHEVSRLRWGDVLEKGHRLHVAASTRYLERVLDVPKPLRELLRIGAQACEPDDYIFRGRTEGSHLGTRMIQQIVRKAARRAGIQRPVCAMTLRHGYAVRRLENGANLRQLQHELGHASIRTTERYEHCLAPRIDNHPFSEVRRRMDELASHNTPHDTARHNRLPRAKRSGDRPLAALQTIDLRKLCLPFGPDDSTLPALPFMRFLKDRLFGGLFRRTSARSP